MSNCRLPPTVAVVILSCNQLAFTLDCIHSVEESNGAPYTMLSILVDNGSDDGTPNIVRTRYPRVRVIENGTNLGYAGGNNVGIRQALACGASHIMVLNNDAALTSGCLVPLVTTLDASPEVGIVTPLIIEPTSEPWIGSLGTRIDPRTAAVTHLRGSEAARLADLGIPVDVDSAHGAAMMTRRDVLERVGLFDEAYYLYFEETDWCLRARELGYRIQAIPASSVRHRRSATAGRNSNLIDYYMTRNHIRLVLRHWRGWRRIWPLAVIATRELAVVAAYTFKGRTATRTESRDARIRGFRDAVLGRWGAAPSDLHSVPR